MESPVRAGTLGSSGDPKARPTYLTGAAAAQRFLGAYTRPFETAERMTFFSGKHLGDERDAGLRPCRAEKSVPIRKKTTSCYARTVLSKRTVRFYRPSYSHKPRDRHNNGLDLKLTRQLLRTVLNGFGPRLFGFSGKFFGCSAKCTARN